MALKIKTLVISLLGTALMALLICSLLVKRESIATKAPDIDNARDSQPMGKTSNYLGPSDAKSKGVQDTITELCINLKNLTESDMVKVHEHLNRIISGLIIYDDGSIILNSSFKTNKTAIYKFYKGAIIYGSKELSEIRNIKIYRRVMLEYGDFETLDELYYQMYFVFIHVFLNGIVCEEILLQSKKIDSELSKLPCFNKKLFEDKSKTNLAVLINNTQHSLQSYIYCCILDVLHRFEDCIESTTEYFREKNEDYLKEQYSAIKIH